VVELVHIRVEIKKTRIQEELIYFIWQNIFGKMKSEVTALLRGLLLNNLMDPMTGLLLTLCAMPYALCVLLWF
jgi:hypothetical protein